MTSRTRMAVLLLAAAASPHPATGGGRSPLDALGIAAGETPRQFCYTNGTGAFVDGWTSHGPETGWEGLTVEGHRFMEDFEVAVDGRPLDRAGASSTVFPDFLRRVYPEGITEELHPVDSADAIVLTIASARPVELALRALLPRGTYSCRAEASALLAAASGHGGRTRAENYPAWLCAYLPGGVPDSAPGVHGASFTPGALIAPHARLHTAVFAVGDSPELALELARRVAESAPRRARERRGHMEALLASCGIRTADERYTQALSWAVLSLDALTVRGGGIYAGLPWFADYWGRDTFIALPGAALVTGRFSESRRILSLFASFQQRDSLSTDYGRIPNRVTSTDTAYNTADGTPRFVMMVREYAERSGDGRFPLLEYPVILRSIEGTLRYHTDSLGFLTHGDAETWMDAAGPDGPWSPRGNRACDIQALWWEQLRTGEYYATQVGDVFSARRWHEAALRLKENFRRHFLRGEEIADRLKADGTPDMTLRPNQMFSAPLLDDGERDAMIDRVVSRLTYPWGVASLVQDDSAFHPFHVAPGLYPKDAAYHNGTVWTWLEGPLISLLARTGGEEIAWRLTGGNVHLALDRGAAGTLPELLDALPRAGESEPRLSGTFSQAWSLAEFIRNYYDDYCGVRYDALHRTLRIAPSLPVELPGAACRTRGGGSTFSVVLTRSASGDEIRVASETGRDTQFVVGTVHVSGSTYMTARTALPPHSGILIRYEEGRLRVLRDGREWPAAVEGELRPGHLAPGLDFATPRSLAGIPAIQPPPYMLISHGDIIRMNPGATALIDRVRTPGPDTPSYTYPRNPAFVPGSFALRRFTLSVDSTWAYFVLGFRALSDPGWHPEYGFQLTFAAIAIDTDGVPGSGERLVGRNASYLLDSAHAYERVIYVGGGVQLEDGHARVLAAYRPLPGDASRPFGDAASGTIRFALPLGLIGRPGPAWTFTVLSGGQDDHGGAGLGEFRTVNARQGEWNGGGKAHPGDPNVYDRIVAHCGETR